MVNRLFTPFARAKLAFKLLQGQAKQTGNYFDKH